MKRGEKQEDLAPPVSRISAGEEDAHAAHPPPASVQEKNTQAVAEA